MSRYASNTSVSPEKSRAEIERTLVRYGAEAFAYASSRTKAGIQFQFKGRLIRFDIPLPDPEADEFTRTPTRGTRRDPDAAYREWEKATRQRWRALALAIKAKLEAVESGISTIEQEFLAWTVLPGGTTVMEQLGGQIADAIEAGRAPVLMIEG